MAAAAVVGGVSAMTPDLDLLIRSRSDPLIALEFHRHFTHALAFAPVGALICALALYPLVGRALGPRACFGFSLLGYASHGLLDACTSYGTLWLWPLSETRVAWDLVSVVDPLFTLPLLGWVAFGVRKGRPLFAGIGIVWCVCYLGLGLLQNHRAAAIVEQLAASRGHAPVSVDVKPSLGNIVLFRTIYAYEGRLYIDAVRAGWDPRVFEGGQRQIVDVRRDFPWLSPGSQQWRDVDRFRRFAGGFVALDPDDSNRVVDLRYSLVPNRLDSLWGIELDPSAAADDHSVYVTMRIRSTAEGKELLRMLLR